MDADTSETGERIPVLDGWRGMAIFALLIGHFLQEVPGLWRLNLGKLGVELFFVLSGTLMARILFLANTPLQLFYRRRVSRIIPAHLFFLVGVTIIAGSWTAHPNWTEVLAAGLFLRNYFPEPASDVGTLPLGHIWSLSVEEHSYILLALVAWWCRRAGRSPVGPLLTLAAVGWLWIGIYSFLADWQDPIFYIRTECRASSVIVSALIALWTHKSGLRFPAWAIPVVLLFGFTAFGSSTPKWLTYTAGSVFLALAVNQLVFAPSWLKTFFSSRALTILGTWSFSIYLWQQPFYLSSFSPAAGLFFAIAAGALSYNLWERPIRRFLNKTWARTDLAASSRSVKQVSKPAAS